MKWYALYVRSGGEEIVKDHLNYYFDEQTLYALIPKRKVPEKKNGAIFHNIKILFPGYVLIKTDMTSSIFYKIKEIPNLYKFVNIGPIYSKLTSSNHAKKDTSITNFSAIDDEEMSPLLRLLGNTDIITYSKIHFENSEVYVNSGPLKGMEGQIKKVDRHKKRAKVLIKFMGSEKLVDLGVEILSSSKNLNISN
ncbi:antiterminator LoaP [Brevibacillus halotolerans]|uniref:antiterminator LoaP n=1 Tax=Brevibacillus halotolerans TaxID=1507437 RepID=UPI0015EFC1EA|nr:antiterminator LoaP [Brevibacillus halotolerans]MBA4532923.1 antiterminator LoaP [Brevibacillus halotolerans]